MLDAIDLFAGPGGWDVAAQDLGLEVHGIEWDHAACETRRAAGLATTEGDVRAYGPAGFPARGLIASPPCQTFSMGGKGAGRQALEVVLSLAKSMAAREEIDLSVFSDERTGLVLEPLRWTLEAIDNGHPYEWLAFEQVPAVLPVWEAFAEILRAEGYTVETGKLQAEQYGVPQTRKRAILVARLGGPVALPTPTHSRYYSRTPEKLDEGVLPWVSMAEALGWAEPRMVVSNYGTGGDPANRGERTSEEEPSATITSKTDRNKVHLGSSAQRNATLRSEDEPASTITGGLDHGERRWFAVRPSISDNGYRKSTDRPVSDPAPTLTTSTGAWAARSDDGAARVTTEEAALLQSFPADYPWQGARTKVFQQIGNAVPPLLARAVLAAVTSRET